MTIKVPIRVLKSAVQDCKSVEEFADKYRRAEFYTAKGAAYALSVIDSHQKDLAILGFTYIPEAESITGKLECYVPAPTSQPAHQ